ncbi:MAG: DUF4091 domain-containing protein [Candidatus Hydrogenedentes bacterium]|nr:DUF4091 domain-containing protein [Candidatus Hydrogenedentota bacterium]
MRSRLLLLVAASAMALSAVAADRHAESVIFDTSYGERVPGSTSEVVLWRASSGWKINRTRPAPSRKAKAVAVSAARNEAEAVQLVVSPRNGLSNLLAEAGALTGPNGAVLAAGCVEILRVRYVNIAHQTDRAGAVALWPDPLPPFAGPIDVPDGENQPLWIRVHVPHDAVAGEYEGVVRLEADGYEASVPLRVRVYDFELPDRMTCTAAFGLMDKLVFRYHAVTDPAQQREILEKYFDTFSAHHVSPYDFAPLDDYSVEWVKLGEGEGAHLDPADRALLQAHPLTPRFDWAAWDKAIQHGVDHHHFSTYRLRNLPGLDDNPSQPQSIQGFEEGTREYDLAFNAYCKALEEHFREKGWLDIMILYWFDEPMESEYEFVLKGFQRVKDAAPGIPRMVTEQVEPGLIGGPNIWCPLPNFYDHEAAEARRAAGERFWWYVCTGPKTPFPGLFIDHPGTDLRAWLWQTWKYKMEGILIWRANRWTFDQVYPDRPQNPYEDPMTWTWRYGGKSPYGNGDGMFIYPPESAAAGSEEPNLDPPVDSMRWEMIRDGIEDYEYFVILKRMLDERGDDLSSRKRKRFEALLEVPDTITEDVSTYTKDPAPIDTQRDRIGSAIEELAALGRTGNATP